jgi:UDP-glucose 4-epimerase
MNNKIKTLVLGGGGFIGTLLVKELLSTGKSVRVLERPNTMKVLKHENLELIEGDFGNKQDIIRSLQNVDVVFHLVSTTQPQTSNLNTSFDVESNLINTLVFLEEIKNMPEVKIIFLSSGGTVYGRPIQIPIPETHPTDP